MDKEDRKILVQQLKDQHAELKQQKADALAALRLKFIEDTRTTREKYEDLMLPIIWSKQYHSQILHSSAWTRNNPERHQEAVNKYYNEGGGKERRSERYWSNPDAYNAKQREYNQRRKDESTEVQGNTGPSTEDQS